MKHITSFLFAALLCCVTTVTAANYCASSAWGNGKNATGGGSATPTLVKSVSELKSALNKGKNKVIIITQDLTFTSMLSVQDGSNVTLMALPGVKLTSTKQDATNSGILYVKRFSNLIIRNITFIGPGAYDCDGNDLLCFENVTNAWVDHCDFQDGCDGNFDNKNSTDNVTVSWCRFRYLKAPKAGGSGGADDHRFTNLLGSSSSDKPSDGTYNFTWAYCWWDEGCKERMVRCRNCELHFLNCYWNSSVANYYVGPENAKCYFEGCTFAGKANSAKNIFKSYGGTNACKFVNSTGNLPSNSGTVNAPTYSYDKLSAADAKTMVTNSSCGAGATLTVNTKGEVGSSCDGGDTPTPDPDPQPDPDPDPDPVTSDLTWDFSTSDFNGLGTITSTTTIKGLTIAASSDKAVTVATGAKTIDGHDFTHVLKTGGTGSAAARSLSFAVTGPCTIQVYLVSANATSERTLNIYSGSYGGTLLTTFTAATTAAKQSYSYTGSATTIYMGSANSGINFYAINVVYSGGDEPPTPPTPTYTLSYDENGGTGTMDSQSAESGQSVTVLANAFTAPTGYTFQEWNTNGKGSGTKYAAGQSVTLTEDLTLYAVWSPLSYTITLDAAGGTGGSGSISAIFDEAMPNITIPSREGYDFLGYFSEPNGAGKQYYDANGSSTNSWITPSDATLYAAWKEQSGDTPATEGDLHFWFFYPADATTNGVTNDASFFSNMIASGSQKAGSITIDGKSYAITRRTGDNAKFGEFTIPGGKKGIFYALAISSGGSDRQINLISNETKIELTVPGGSDSYKRIESEELPAGSYSIEREGSGNVRLGVVVVKTIDDGGEVPPTPLIYTVTWDANGGVCATASSSVQENTAVGELPEASREGYTFDGWFNATEGGEQISAETIIVSDTIFYAHYTENPEPPTPPTPSGSDVIFYWQMSGTTAPANNDVLPATGGTLTIQSTDAGKTFSVESTAYAENVPEDMKAQDGKGLKNGGNALHMIAALTEGSFLAGDTIFICGYNPWKISSSVEKTGDLIPAIATGTSKADYQIGYAVLPSAADALYFSRAEGTGTCIAAIKVSRPSPSVPTDIEHVEKPSAARKVLRHGQVLILREDASYDLFGRRVD